MAEAGGTSEQQDRRWVVRAARVAVAVPTFCLLLVFLATAAGYRALIVRTGSMAPVINQGDVAITRVARPARIAADDVVTFLNPSRSRELVALRVTQVRHVGTGFVLIMQGTDTGTEPWSVDADARVGVLTYRVPKAGYLLAWVLAPGVTAALLAATVLFLGLAMARRARTRSPRERVRLRQP
jgi:signal peptidase I